MEQYGFFVNTDICTGCKACMTSCFDRNNLEVPQKFRKVYEFGGGEWKADDAGAFTATAFTYYVSMTCGHCENPACVANCPTGAMQKDEETGLVNSDPEVCIGCGTCRNSCPYDAPRIDAELSRARKCDGCLARVRNEEQPMCVGACPLRALEFGPIDELREKYGDTSQVAPLPEPTTAPNLVIGSCQAIDSNTYNLDEGYIANPLEVE